MNAELQANQTTKELAVREAVSNVEKERDDLKKQPQ
tara:strand:- start:21360 stop:21467 length:108 start_codon:yes stop_codon:yes gene_type:complete